MRPARDLAPSGSEALRAWHTSYRVCGCAEDDAAELFTKIAVRGDGHKAPAGPPSTAVGAAVVAPHGVRLAACAAALAHLGGGGLAAASQKRKG